MCVSDMGDLTSQNSWSRNQRRCPVDNPDSATALLEWAPRHTRHTGITQAWLKGANLELITQQV